MAMEAGTVFVTFSAAALGSAMAILRPQSVTRHEGNESGQHQTDMRKPAHTNLPWKQGNIDAAYPEPGN
jgi:hypothetical protein